MDADRVQTWAEACVEEARRRNQVQELVDAWLFLQGKASMLFGMACTPDALSDPSSLATRVRDALHEQYRSADGSAKQEIWRALGALGLTEGLSAPVLEAPPHREHVAAPRVIAPAGTVAGPYRALSPSVADLSVPEIWQRVENWLADRYPAFLEKLAPPALDADIAELEAAMGAPLPEDYRSSLRIHAGCVTHTRDDGEAYDDSPFDFVWLLQPKRVLAVRSWLEQYAKFDPPSDPTSVVGAIQHVFYDPLWFPIAAGDDNLSVYYCMDAAPTVRSAYGQIIDFSTDDDDREAKWPSFRAFLAGALLLPLETQSINEEDTLESGLVLLDE